MMGFRAIGGLGRLAAMGGLALVLAGCAGPDGTGPFASLRNPFKGIATMDPDMRGRIGGALDTSTAGGAGGAATPGAVTDPFAGQGVRATQPPEGAGPGAAGTGAARGNGAAATPTVPAAARSHVVSAGETAWSIARRYGVTVTALASANALPEAMTVRVGQRLTIPAAGPATRVVVTAPGAGSPTPQPPSASKPLPDEKTAPAAAPVSKPASPDLGATRTAASGNGRFAMPVNGAIVRAYAKGRNEGIDISAPAGTPVKAAGAGTVAAITRDTDGVPIVVIRHDGTLMTVYAGLDALTVAKGEAVAAGQVIGKANAGGILHFEVRQGFDSVDPETYLG